MDISVAWATFQTGKFRAGTPRRTRKTVESPIRDVHDLVGESTLLDEEDLAKPGGGLGVGDGDAGCVRDVFGPPDCGGITAEPALIPRKPITAGGCRC
jgi:hypothetical protein